MRDSFDSFISASWHISQEIDLDNLGGRIVESLSLHARAEPYVIRSDITVMPEATLHIYPDVVMEFAPNVGILVLGTLKAVGVPGHEIVMKPMKRINASVNSTFVKPAPTKSSTNLVSMSDETIRLCKDGGCSSLYNEGEPKNINISTLKKYPSLCLIHCGLSSYLYLSCFICIYLVFFRYSNFDEYFLQYFIVLFFCIWLHYKYPFFLVIGFLEYFNRTTLQWIPICDERFTERNAQVACRQLGYDTLNVYVSYDRRYELHPGSLTRVWSWPEPLQVRFVSSFWVLRFQKQFLFKL